MSSVKFMHGPIVSAENPCRDTMRMENGSLLHLVVVEDSIPAFRRDLEDGTRELWTYSAALPGVFLRCGPWPENADNDRLVEIAHFVRLMDEESADDPRGRYSLRR